MVCPGGKDVDGCPNQDTCESIKGDSCFVLFLVCTLEEFEFFKNQLKLSKLSN